MAEFVHAGKGAESDQQGQYATDEDAFTQNLVRTGKQPLHQGEFLALDAIAAAPRIEPWIEDVEIFPVKIVDHRLCLYLPPNVRAHQIYLESAPVHGHAEQGQHYKQDVQRIFAQKRRNVGQWHGKIGAQI
jgi:hypothetical protein